VSFDGSTVMDMSVKKTPNPSSAPKIPRNAEEKARSADAKIDSRMKFMNYSLIDGGKLLHAPIKIFEGQECGKSNCKPKFSFLEMKKGNSEVNGGSDESYPDIEKRGRERATIDIGGCQHQ